MQGISLEGYRETIRIFDELQSQLQKRLVRQALRQAACILLVETQRQAPRLSGRLAQSLRIVSLRKDRVPTTVPMAVAPVFDDYGNGSFNMYYARFVHEGTKDRHPKKKKALKINARGEGFVYARSARGIAPNPFLLRAFNAAADATAEEFGERLKTVVERFAAKNNTRT